MAVRLPAGRPLRSGMSSAGAAAAPNRAKAGAVTAGKGQNQSRDACVEPVRAGGHRAARELGGRGAEPPGAPCACKCPRHGEYEQREPDNAELGKHLQLDRVGVARELVRVLALLEVAELETAAALAEDRVVAVRPTAPPSRPPSGSTRRSA